MKSVLEASFKTKQTEIDRFIDQFEHSGVQFGKAARNTIKVFKLGAKEINIKSFKVPNMFNQIAYKFLRKSKAQRSFEYANILIEKGIGTPQPIAYYEDATALLFKKSFYVSEHVNCDLTYRTLTKDFDYPDYETILRAFTRFTFRLHENHIHFLDHSPGNTLIKKVNGDYQFYLVDLNRMRFESMDFKMRIKNFSRLTIHKSMVEIMSDEYAKLINEDAKKVFQLMWNATETFQRQFYRKKRWKKRLKFWKA
ncbi:lipopolysaccharide kinase (Kdo/WaaP) family protein [Flavobacteriaceae bacterium MAR_2010_72]|nr:lipopolysaccharide kinase (Kdo/WaaP) family protein [Flavobacteriaceae bacterium MAR_2010_72]TVZ60271.1 lipopolysaccharide kinase (Kdo/WaaP) family protein [Flavobacteriaceae bacterium MAR_2010_105]